MAKVDTSSTTNLAITIIHITQYVFLGILVVANLFGLFFVYNSFMQITQSDPQEVQPIADKLIPPFNQALYDQIKKDRANRQLFSSNSQIQQFSYPEVFKPGN